MEELTRKKTGIQVKLHKTESSRERYKHNASGWKGKRPLAIGKI